LLTLLITDITDTCDQFIPDINNNGRQFAAVKMEKWKNLLGGEAHSPAVEGLGESQFDDWRKNLALCTSCYILFLLSASPAFLQRH
jgi:hypothetical protein